MGGSRDIIKGEVSEKQKNICIWWHDQLIEHLFRIFRRDTEEFALMSLYTWLHLFGPRFLTFSTIDILSWVLLHPSLGCVQLLGCPLHCRRFTDLPGLYALTRCTHCYPRLVVLPWPSWDDGKHLQMLLYSWHIFLAQRFLAQPRGVQISCFVVMACNALGGHPPLLSPESEQV